MNRNLSNDQESQQEDSFDFVALFFRYLHYWYYFVASVFLVVTAMFFYLKTVTPVYDVEASVIIEDPQDKKSPSSMMGMDVENLGIFSSTNNFDNEIEILQSRTLIKNTLIKTGQYIRYYKRGTFRDEIINDSPVMVWMTPEEAENLTGWSKLSIKLSEDNKLDVLATFYDEEGEEIEYNRSFDSIPAILSTPQGSFSFSAGSNEATDNWLPEDELIITVSNPIAAAKGVAQNLSIQPSSKSTTIANITLRSSNVLRAKEFITTLVALYNKDANDYKNEVALKTSEFINERISIINQELGSTEAELETFKRDAGITDLESDAKLVLEENSAYKQRTVENSTQLRLVQFLSEYASNPDNQYEVLPLNVGLSDINLSQLIGNYNTMLLERKRLLVTSTENNPAVVNLDASIASMRRNVLTSIGSVKEGLLITQSDLEREANKYAGRISSAPTQERELISISRQQNIQSTLYLMLLQKREENALTLASTANNARIFNDPLSPNTPVAPNKKMYILISLILGLAIPMGVVYIKDLFSFKIESREDVENITSVPILADIPICLDKPKDTNIVVHENTNDMMAESFRALRTNLLFMLTGEAQVVMITSTSSGEGKSFTSSNLAVSLALMGKKVVIVGLDIRKPGLNKAFGISSHVKGISNYLADPSIDLLSMVQKSEVSSNLSILLGGTIPPNPTELLSRNTLDQAISILKDNYDYVILDTAPIGMVTDTQLIARTADVSIYVCRANYTNKADYKFINALALNNKLPNLTTVVNNIDLRKRRYGYGYGGKYGYGNQYGYGYGQEHQK